MWQHWACPRQLRYSHCLSVVAPNFSSRFSLRKPLVRVRQRLRSFLERVRRNEAASPRSLHAAGRRRAQRAKARRGTRTTGRGLCQGSRVALSPNESQLGTTGIPQCQGSTGLAAGSCHTGSSRPSRSMSKWGIGDRFSPKRPRRICSSETVGATFPTVFCRVGLG
jgi:hypothetical protein